jgi:DNA recombination protein Rad52|tara:strand:+ start:751 stop:1440 length:690 start_codon:yes stop_codon:yes gene_type:complete
MGSIQRFDANQTKLLKDKLDRSAIKKRPQAGMNVSYIEGWHAIAEANRIFGFGNWSRETLSMECVTEGVQKCTYIARVRVGVLADDGITIFREGTGAGHGTMKDAGQNHESASKEAETDAMKRALVTFGNQFGLALYDKDQAEVGTAIAAKEEAAKEKSAATSEDQLWINEAIKNCNESEWDNKTFEAWKDEIREQFTFIYQRNKEAGQELVDALAEKSANILESENAK